MHQQQHQSLNIYMAAKLNEMRVSVNSRLCVLGAHHISGISGGKFDDFLYFRVCFVRVFLWRKNLGFVGGGGINPRTPKIAGINTECALT